MLLLVFVPALTAGGILRRRARGPQGRPRARGGFISNWLAFRRMLRLKERDHENGMLRDKARHEHRLREQEAQDRRAAARARGAHGATVPGEAWTTETTDRPGPDSPRVKLRPETPADGGSEQPPGPQAPPGSGGSPGGPAAPPASPGPSSSPGAPPARERTDPDPSPSPEPPARGSGQRPSAAPPPARPAPGPNGTPPPLEGTIVTTPAVTPEAVPGVEMVIEGLRRIYAHAMAGNIQAKRRAVLALAEIGRRSAMTALTLARAMAEPGQHYGTAVTERIARVSALFSGAATAAAEADAELHAILVTTPGEAMAGGRPMPHHEQFTETGAR